MEASRWKSGLRNGAIRIFLGVERVFQIPFRRRRLDPVRTMIEPYRSYGTTRVLHVKGRVLRKRALARSETTDSRRKTLGQTLRRIFSGEIAGAPVEAEWRGHRASGATNDEGYFHLRLEPVGAVDTEEWESVEVRLAIDQAPPVRASAPVLIPRGDAELGIVSDIDDTVIRTSATSLFRMLRTVMLDNAHVRLPFEGVAAFYRALHRGRNPLFYVSSGPWNLYDLIEHIFELRGIPPGPIFLQDWGIERGKLIVAPHDDHKLENIDTIVGTYPDLAFLLIGDSGQRDPEIYATVARHYPSRVLAIYIRDVTRRARHDEVRRLADELERETGVPLVLVPDTLAAARHAAERGWILPEFLSEIAGEKARDESSEEPKL